MAAARPSLGWNLRQSLWLLVPVGTLGFLGGAALLVVGSRAKRPLWWIIGLVHLTLSGVALALYEEAGSQEQIAMWLLLTCWVAGSSFAVAINPEYLRFKWERDHGAAQPTRTKGRTTGSRSGSQLNTRRQPRDRLAAGGNRSASTRRTRSRAAAPSAHGRAPRRSGAAGAQATAPTSASAPEHTAVPAAAASKNAGTAAEPVNVNVATADEFEQLPGFSRALAAKAVEAREKRGSFTSEQDFAAALDLAPHVFQRLRGRIVCGRAPQAPPSFGRMVDY